MEHITNSLLTIVLSLSLLITTLWQIWGAVELSAWWIWLLELDVFFSACLLLVWYDRCQQALVWAFFGGLLLDILSLWPFQGWSLVYITIVYMAYWLHNWTRDWGFSGLVLGVGILSWSYQIFTTWLLASGIVFTWGSLLHFSSSFWILWISSTVFVAFMLQWRKERRAYGRP